MWREPSAIATAVRSYSRASESNDAFEGEPADHADRVRVGERRTVAVEVRQHVQPRGAQIDVPVKGDPEAGGRLLLGQHAMGEVDFELDLPREGSKQRRLVLDRMAGQDAEAHRRHGGAAPSSAAMRADTDRPVARAVA
jgi:hypothetical protein